MSTTNRMGKRTSKVKPFMVMDVLARAQQLMAEGRSIIRLEIGEPDFPTPACVVEAAQKALGEGATTYTHSLGLLELREAISEYYFKNYGVEVSPARILITMGSSAALTLAVASTIEAGEKVLLTDPAYACYPAFLHLTEAQPLYVPLDESDGFRIHPEQVLPYADKAKAIIINSPANPTGQMVEPETLAALANSGLTVISDEIYHGLTYGKRAHSILEFTDQAFVVDGFSKRYAMTGWRLGWLVAPTEYVRSAQIWQQNLFISACHFAQKGGVAAIREAGPELERMRGIYHERRDYIVSALRELGFGLPVAPDGAYYVLANAKFLDSDALRLSRAILEEAGVAITAGDDFGELSHGYIRFSYANSLDNLKEAVRRIREWISKR
ncbi:MAG: pyridoxal phosphate-dependent aminotransferase [bacterium]